MRGIVREQIELGDRFKLRLRGGEGRGNGKIDYRGRRLGIGIAIGIVRDKVLEFW
jgi:hypothetical protein